MIKFKILIENKTNNPGIVAEHGLSIYIEADKKKILFDAGATDLFADNASEMKVDLESIDFAVISHGHYDHTGGFPLFHEINEKAPIYLRPEALKPSFDDSKCQKPTGIRWSQDERKAIEPNLRFTEGPCKITENIVVSGLIPIEQNQRPTEDFFCEKEGKIVPDDMNHEQFLAIRDENGITLFSGCSHKGVVVAIDYCKKLFPGEKIHMLVAGMHLYSANEETRKRVIDTVIKEDVEKIAPVHCTGIDAICQIKNMVGERCIVVTSGDSYGY